MDKHFSYYRVSSENQRDGASLEAQREANLRYAHEHGLEIVKEFEEVQSAAKEGRKQFNLMLAELERNKSIRGIIFHDVDRIARSLKDYVRVSYLPDRGYRIHLSRENTELNSDSIMLTANMKAVLAEHFSKNLSQETKKGIYKRMEQGLHMTGYAMLGYKAMGKGVRDVNPLVAPLIQQCFELYASGRYSMTGVAEEMYKRGLRSRSGKKLDKPKIHRLLTSRFYIGIMEMKGKLYHGNHEPLISVELFEKVQQIRKTRHPGKKKKFEYLFRGILFCNQCGCKLRTLTAKGRYRYYYCRNKQCPVKNIGEPHIEQGILQHLKTITFTDQEVEQMIQLAKDSRQSMTLQIEERKKNLALQIENTKGKISRLVDLNIEGKISQEDYHEKHNELTLQRANFESQLRSLKGAKDTYIQETERLAKLLRDPVLAYTLANSDNKLNLLQKMFKVIKTDTNGVYIEWQTPFDQLYQSKRTPSE